MQMLNTHISYMDTVNLTWSKGRFQVDQIFFSFFKRKFYVFTNLFIACLMFYIKC